MVAMALGARGACPCTLRVIDDLTSMFAVSQVVQNCVVDRHHSLIVHRAERE